MINVIKLCYLWCYASLGVYRYAVMCYDNSFTMILHIIVCKYVVFFARYVNGVFSVRVNIKKVI